MKVDIQDLEGSTIQSVRPMHDWETLYHGWSQSCMVIELTDGTIIYPSYDDEGNAEGVLMVMYSLHCERLIPNRDTSPKEVNRWKGKIVHMLRPMAAREQRLARWIKSCAVLELNDGTVFYPACDEEHNGPGVWFVLTPEGLSWGFSVFEQE